MRRHASPRLLPVIGVVLYVVAWVGQIAAGTHASQPHVRCAEHGEFSHLAIPTADGVYTGTQDRVVRGSDPIASAHEHCPMAVLIDQATWPSRIASPPIALIQGDSTQVAARSSPRSVPTERLLLAAPKTSPPVA